MTIDQWGDANGNPMLGDPKTTTEGTRPLGIDNTTRRMRDRPLTDAEIARFWSNVGKRGPDDCWEWTRARMGGTHHYGQFRAGGHLYYAHRVSFELSREPIPDGRRVLHHCDNPPCCNPAHLFTGTAHDNTQDMLAKQRGGYTPHQGSANGFSKLTEEDVRQIFAMHAQGRRQVAIAAAFGVTQANISIILKGLGWRHVDPSEAAITAMEAESA